MEDLEKRVDLLEELLEETRQELLELTDSFDKLLIGLRKVSRG